MKKNSKTSIADEVIPSNSLQNILNSLEETKDEECKEECKEDRPCKPSTQSKEKEIQNRQAKLTKKGTQNENFYEQCKEQVNSTGEKIQKFWKNTTISIQNTLSSIGKSISQTQEKIQNFTQKITKKLK